MTRNPLWIMASGLLLSLTSCTSFPSFEGKSSKPDQLADLAKCLPPGYGPDTCIWIAVGGKTTVRPYLEQMGAYCRDGKIFDPSGREVYFYQTPGYGAQLLDYSRRLHEDERHLNDLKKRYHVIQLYWPYLPS